MATDPSRPGFGEQFLSSAGFDVFCFQKRAENWYQDVSCEEMGLALRHFLREYESVFTYGSSMGAYAALYFAGALGARALAFSPRHPDYYRYAGNPSYKHAFALRHRRLYEVANRRARHVVVFDPRNAIDAPYFEQEVAPAFPSAVVLRFNYSAHPAIQCFHEAHTLKALVLNFLAGAEPGPAHKRFARRRSPTYLNNLSSACVARGHARWANNIRGFL
jgi:hypothetical protein